MLATGGSASKAIALLKEQGVPESHIVFVNVIASVYGLDVITKKFPELNIVTAAVDSDLDEKRYADVYPFCTYLQRNPYADRVCSEQADHARVGRLRGSVLWHLIYSISSVTIVSSCAVRRVRSFGDLGEDIILPGRVGVLAVVRGFGYRRQIRSYTYIFGCKRSRRWLILLLDSRYFIPLPFNIRLGIIILIC